MKAQSEVINLLQRSVIEAKDNVRKEWEDAKPTIVACIQSQYAMWAKQGFHHEPLVSDELMLGIKNSNMPRTQKDELIRRLG